MVTTDAHPAGSVEVILVGPAAIAPTFPVKSTVATKVLALLHVPPVVPSFNGIIEPEQAVASPLIGNGDGFTVIGIEAEQPAAV
jgi:hypothetical protein